MELQDWLSHKELMLIRGVNKTPGDTYSAEVGPVVVNLMGGMFTLREWSPNIPALKSGGVWTESPLSDGRRLVAAAAGNVTEKIEVLLSDASYLGIQQQLSSLNLLIKGVRDYWTGDAQIEPLYLHWWASCGAAPQYALISNIEIDTEYQESPTPSMVVIISLEREPYWRGVPPGANPKLWSYYARGQSQAFNVNTASLVSGTDHLITDTLANQHSWSPTGAYGTQIAPLFDAGQYYKHYIDISAAQVPGDAPALLELSINSTGNAPANIYIGKSSKDMLSVAHDGTTRAGTYILNGGDGVPTGVTGTKNSGGAGVVSNNSSYGTFWRVLRTSTGIDANYTNYMQWGYNAGAGSYQKLDRQFMRGTFAIFARGYNASAVSPVVTDMKIRVLFEEYEEATNQIISTFISSEANPGLGAHALTYLGTVSIPFENRAVVSPLGYGIQIGETASNLRITLQQQVLVATANRTYDFIDLIFMPIDEGLAQIALPYSQTSSAQVTILDNTGYLSRGETEQVAAAYITNANSGGIGQEVRGGDIMLEPRTPQRLYIICEGYQSSTILSSLTAQTNFVRLNIVPRWSGIRDV